jgi:FkbM family methyltransferase
MSIYDYLNFSNGFYIEAGAHDGQYESNTINLEKNLGWNGILIEPNEDMIKKCISNRGKNNIIINCALVSSDYPHENIIGSFVDDGKCTQEGQIVDHISEHFSLHKIQEIEIIKNTRKLTTVKAFTLQKILDSNEIKHIDFISLDVEGYEEEVLRGIDLTKNSPKFMLIETGNSRIREFNIDNYLKRFNYKMVFRENNDTFYMLE